MSLCRTGRGRGNTPTPWTTSIIESVCNQIQQEGERQRAALRTLVSDWKKRQTPIVIADRRRALVLFFRGVRRLRHDWTQCLSNAMERMGLRPDVVMGGGMSTRNAPTHPYGSVLDGIAGTILPESPLVLDVRCARTGYMRSGPMAWCKYHTHEPQSTQRSMIGKNTVTAFFWDSTLPRFSWSLPCTSSESDGSHSFTFCIAYPEPCASKQVSGGGLSPRNVFHRSFGEIG